ncbi:MAG: ornithine cyclodeaminase family protein [Nitrospinota bacterium]|nr:ornithine cyclodeaminase family protein [Nitrospinota bacterium]
MLYLNENEIESLVTMPDVMRVVDECFKLQGKGKATNQPRRRIYVPEGMMHVMFASLIRENEGYLGLKTYTAFPGIGVRFIFLLWDASSSELLALMEANLLGQLRTGAASGVAAKYMSNELIEEACLIGTGRQAGTQLEAICLAREIKRVKIYSRNKDKRDAFISRMQKKVNPELIAVDDPSKAVRGSKIICTMTNASDPVFEGKHIEPGSTIIAAGSNRISNREIDDETFRKASRGRIVTDNIEGATFESGDLVGAVNSKIINWGQVVEIGLLASGTMSGRSSEEEINLFLSQGVASEDVALGSELFKLAKEQNLGTELPVDGFLKKPS